MNKVFNRCLGVSGWVWVGCMLAGAAQGQVINDTGSHRCIDGAGGVAAVCAGTGQDGETGRDVTHADPSDGLGGFGYQRVCHSGQLAGEGRCASDPPMGPGPDDWGCTLDLVTGLMWEIKTIDGGLRDRQRIYTNHLPGAAGYGAPGDASGYANAVNAAGLCGARDWHLPDRRQLDSLLNYGLAHPGPLVDERYFPHTLNRAHWSASASASGTPSDPAAIGVLLDWGGASYAERRHAYPVRLVRFTRPPPAGGHYAISADGQEVSDARTGLTWRRCVEGMRWSGGTCTGAASGLSWLQALNRTRNTGGAWRMPNVRELASLLEDGRLRPAINTLVFPATPDKWHWSSTPLASDPAYVWSAAFHDARVSEHSHLNSGYRRVLRLVRGGL